MITRRGFIQGAVAAAIAAPVAAKAAEFTPTWEDSVYGGAAGGGKTKMVGVHTGRTYIIPPSPHGFVPGDVVVIDCYGRLTKAERIADEWFYLGVYDGRAVRIFA